MKVLFLYLNAFSFVGGIQKFNLNFLKALDENKEKDFVVNALSLSDLKKDLNKDFSRIYQQTAEDNKFTFLLKAVVHGLKSDTIIFGHVNLIFPLTLIYGLFTNKKLILITHGIEIWKPLSFFKKICLRKLDLIITVSSYTKDKIVDIQKIDEKKIALLPNTLEPGFNFLPNAQLIDHLREKYGLKRDDKVLLTVCRLSKEEQYKGYDKVIRSLKVLSGQISNIKYVIAGKYDIEEKDRLLHIIKECGVEEKVILTGYVSNEELSSLYHLCDLFIMPSANEGFGIVFLEALACGKPVIGGNKDGSVDALLNGELGLLVDPDNGEEISEAVRNILLETADTHLLDPVYLKEKCISAFGFEKFADKVGKLVLKRELKEELINAD
ncbi:a-glycosyltransferase [Sporocytophaga myxococcoides]|uniref:A-glycosyltransferase n=1 Tax=Sporocytophaga myxococcoides TaxID=153721 RepID=A0A098LAR8_9BACT|nr:glycosyltransferase family 4 protein [Sporocytophaga myxococcoides]GAL84061.1 a-glycosyltransferase [Sporocytophaga myxococcoides]